MQAQATEFQARIEAPVTAAALRADLARANALIRLEQASRDATANAQSRLAGTPTAEARATALQASVEAFNAAATAGAIAQQATANALRESALATSTAAARR